MAVAPTCCYGGGCQNESGGGCCDGGAMKSDVCGGGRVIRYGCGYGQGEQPMLDQSALLQQLLRHHPVRRSSHTQCRVSGMVCVRACAT